MKSNLFQKINFKDSKETVTYFKSIKADIVPRRGEELVEITSENIQNLIVEKVIYNLDKNEIDFANVFLRDIALENSDDKEELKKFLEDRGWTLSEEDDDL